MEKIKIEVKDEDLKILDRERKNNETRKVREKASAIYYRALGHTEDEIREYTGLAVCTIIAHVKGYKNDGLNYIYTTNYKKRQSKLEPYTEQIKEEFKENPPKTRLEAKTKIKELFGIEIGITAIGNFLKKKGLRIKKLEASQQKQIKKSKKNF